MMGRLPLRATLLGVLLALLFLPALSPGASSPVAAQTSTISLEQELAERYAPIVMIKKQEKVCSTDGEQFRPVVVDVLFGTDDVRLMKRGNGGKSTDTEVKRNIQASDLYGLDSSYYIDLPGEPRNPGCTYEKWGKKRMAELGIEPSLYARVVSEPDEDAIVVQYWYYWVFNLFNNTHESDWEGIQLNFTASSVQEILDNNLLPTSIAFAQHEGGEKGDWDDDKVEKQGTHIVSHPSSGSHADYYQSAIWLGWGENGSGFGCDYSDDPDVELPVSIVLIPNEVTDPKSAFAWLTFQGPWGEREVPSMFSGPTGPIGKPRWDHPVAWSESIRDNSLPVPVHSTIGPGISQVFCGAAELGSRIVRVFPVDPQVVGGIGVVALVGLLALAALAWRYVWRAVRLYFRHGYFFITTGVVAFPIAWVGQRIEEFLQRTLFSQIDPRLPTSTYSRTLYQFVLHAGVGGVQEIFLACIIGPIAIIATYELVRDDAVRFRDAWPRGVRRFPTMLGATLYVAALLTVMTVSVILIPLVIYKGVQWAFAPEAVVVDKAGVRSARHVSAKRMSRHWFRGAAVVTAVAVVSGLPGPLIGTAGLILGGVELEQAQWISAAVYCVLYPISLIMATLFFLNISIAPGLVESYDPAPSAPEIEPIAAPGGAPA